MLERICRSPHARYKLIGTSIPLNLINFKFIEKQVKTLSNGWQRTKEPLLWAPLMDIMDELPCRALKFISHSQKKVMQKNLFMIFLSYRTTMHSLSSPVCFFVFNFQAWKWCVFPLLIYLTERLTRVFRSFQKVELIDVKNFASTFKLSDALELLHAVFSF